MLQANEVCDESFLPLFFTKKRVGLGEAQGFKGFRKINSQSKRSLRKKFFAPLFYKKEGGLLGEAQGFKGLRKD